MEERHDDSLILSPCSRGCGRGTAGRNSHCNSPEFEFWMTRNPSFPQPNLLSADVLFSGGVLLPLRLLHLHAQPIQGTELPSGRSEPEFGSLSNDLSDSSMLTPSNRWKDIFKKSDEKSSCNSVNVDDNNKDKDNNSKEKKREKKNGGFAGASNGNISAAELNIINIWPFSRSKSAGNGGTRPRVAAAIRKVSSAPCSRSNSSGESKPRKWPNSLSRVGVHLGKSSPVCHARRSGGGRSKSTAEKGVKKDGSEERRNIKTAVSSSVGGGNKGTVLNFKVPMCIGAYRHHLSCGGDENRAIGVATAAARGGSHSHYGKGGGGGASSEGVRGSNLFNIRSLFTKKVY